MTDPENMDPYGPQNHALPDTGARDVSRVYSHGYRTRDAEQEQADEYKARAAMWHKLGKAVIDPNDMTSDLLAQVVINEANRLYGPRKDIGEK